MSLTPPRARARASSRSHGTREQQGKFLPRLADGTLIPCFGLTGVHSGSDATSLIGSYGTVERDASGALGVRATFDKRYITLAPVAGIVGIGFDLKDPDGLLDGATGAGEGFTVALLERDHPGLRMGPRHMPLAAAFMNGTVQGEDVWIPMDAILGGEAKCGQGWHMFVEALAEGRGVSLPAAAVAAARGLVPSVGAYARARKQFKVPIAEFGGVQEAVARMGAQALVCVSGAELMNAIVDNHEAPMVLSSIMKQSTTDRARAMAVDAMDVTAGAGIMGGPANFAGSPYVMMPIAITVEGANIMTRSFQIIGQGLTRCHPHMLDVLEALQAPADDKGAPGRFATGVYKMVGHFVANFALSLSRGLQASASSALRADPGAAAARAARASGSDAAAGDALALAPSTGAEVDALVAHHEAHLRRLAANFALAADAALLLGGKLKFEELLMGRLADAIGAVYLGFATLHHVKRNGEAVPGLAVVAEHALQGLEREAQEALREACANFPGLPGRLGLGRLVGFALAPAGELTRPHRPPSDALTREVARLLSVPSALREHLMRPALGGGMYTGAEPDGTESRIALLARALPTIARADATFAAAKKAGRALTADEQALADEAARMRDEIVRVDVFEKVGPLEGQEGYERPALAQTAEYSARRAQEHARLAAAA